jgi:hypothetical protein
MRSRATIEYHYREELVCAGTDAALCWRRWLVIAKCNKIPYHAKKISSDIELE